MKQSFINSNRKDSKVKNLNSTISQTQRSRINFKKQINSKHKIYNLIILDESGSMESIKSNIISGFNEVIQSIKGIEKQFPEQEHYISFVTFNGLGVKTHLENQSVKKIKQIDEKLYKPDSVTPLFDAIGFSVNELKRVLENEKGYNVLVTILTDGLENSSKEFSGSQINKIIKDLKLSDWTFTYIGTGHDIESVAKSISITNTMFFDKNENSIRGMFVAEKAARLAFCKNVVKNKASIDN